MLLTAMMPVYNAEESVADAITTIIGQTFQDWELVIVDDGSTDRTYEICSAFAGNDRRIRLFRYPHGGRGLARNRCLKHSRGGVVVICDADDLFFPERFSTHAEHFASDKEVGISCASNSIIFSDLMEVESMYYYSFPVKMEKIRKNFSRGKMAINHPGSAIAKWVYEEYGWYDIRLQRCQDYGFFRRLISETKIVCTDVPMVLYRANQTLLDWEYFWESKRYQWLADRLLHSKPRTEVNGRVEGVTDVPNAWFVGKAYLQYVRNRYRQKRFKRVPLSRRDHERILRLLSGLPPTPAAFSRDSPE